MDKEKKEKIMEDQQREKQKFLDTYSKQLSDPNTFMAHPSKRVLVAIRMIALGFTKRETAQYLGITEARLREITKSKSVQKEIDRISSDLFVQNPQKLFQMALPSAFRKVKKLMQSAQKESVQLAAASMIFDRALGKPTQEIKHEGSGIRQLLEALDKKNVETLQPKDIIEAEFKEVSEQIVEKKDELDQWLDENL
jgi:predicted transcriptional regulator